jgi:hypothetical protein
MVNKKEYYKEEGGGFLQVQAMVNLMNLCMPMAGPCTKCDLIMH